MPNFNRSEDKKKEHREKVESERQWKEQVERDRLRRRTATTTVTAETPKPLSHKEKRLRNRLEVSLVAASNEESNGADLSNSTVSNDTSQMPGARISRKNSAQDDDYIDELADNQMESDDDNYSFFKKKQPTPKEKKSQLSGKKQTSYQTEPPKF